MSEFPTINAKKRVSIPYEYGFMCTCIHTDINTLFIHTLFMGMLKEITMPNKDEKWFFYQLMVECKRNRWDGLE
jgi:hypothetical protein